MRTADFDFDLPPELIAQAPADARDHSRLLVLDRASGQLQHRQFRNLLDYLSAGDALVMNDSRVIPARLRGRNLLTGGEFELLLLEQNEVNDWWVMLRPGRRARVGTRIVLRDSKGNAVEVTAQVVETNEEGHRRLHFRGTPDIVALLDELGEVPLPPYIRRDKGASREDRERYQTVFAHAPGSVAAPTAGLHFTVGLLDEARRRGVQVCFVTLHVGLGTFAPVKSENLSEHKMHYERYELSSEAAGVITEARRAGKRILAVGTTAVRVLESIAAQTRIATRPSGSPSQLVATPTTGRTNIFIHPPYNFKLVDGLLTNFHLPRSTLMMLVSAFAAPGKCHGRDLVVAAYAEAIQNRYRFFSYGDAMLIL